MEQCIPNIGLRERRRRLMFGVILLGVSVAALAALLAARAAPRWRAALFPLLWGAGVGFFQWRDKT